MMKNQSHLVFEFKKINEAIENNDLTLVEKYHKEYTEKLSVPKGEVEYSGPLTICSKNISYHLLSMYFLLDTLEYFWNGNRILDRAFKKDMFLFKELNLTEQNDNIELSDIYTEVNKVSPILQSKLYVFFLPFKFEKDFVLQTAFPGNVLLVYANDQDIKQTFLKGVGCFYLRSKLKNKLPVWAENEEQFSNEFLNWYNNKPSQFNI